MVIIPETIVRVGVLLLYVKELSIPCASLNFFSFWNCGLGQRCEHVGVYVMCVCNCFTFLTFRSHCECFKLDCFKCDLHHSKQQNHLSVCSTLEWSVHTIACLYTCLVASTFLPITYAIPLSTASDCTRAIISTLSFVVLNSFSFVRQYMHCNNKYLLLYPPLVNTASD